MRLIQISNKNQINNAQMRLFKKNDSKCVCVFFFKGQIPEDDLVLPMKLCPSLQKSLG